MDTKTFTCLDPLPHSPGDEGNIAGCHLPLLGQRMQIRGSGAALQDVRPLKKILGGGAAEPAELLS